MLCTPHQISFGERRGAYRVLVGKTEGRRLLERPRRRWEDNIKMGWLGGTDWISVRQDRDRWRGLVNTVMNHKCGEFLE